MLKVAYISPTYFSNVDIPFIEEMRHLCEIHYFPIVPSSGKGYAINLTHLPSKADIYSGTDFDELKKFKDLIDLSKTHVVYRKAVHSWEWSNWKVSFQLVRILKKEHFDVIHITDSWRYFEWPLLRLRNKTILSVHDPFLHSSMQNKFAHLYRWISFHSFQHFILFNKEQFQSFIDTYHLQDKNVYCSQLSVYSYLSSYAKPQHQDRPYALYIGTIRPYKGLEYLFAAMEKVHQKHPTYQLIVAGSGKYYFDIEIYKNCDYIKIINTFLSDEEQAPLIANSDFVVCPYKDATQSGVIMSAYAFEKPCVVTRTGGLPEMVGNGDYGLIVPPCAVDELADAMCQMIENPTLRNQFAKKIHDNYYLGEKSWSTIVSDIVAHVYSKIN
ncbi:MAG: glycosyltransferase family 4 protein [Paludibacteraceae bacterium]|nr:glycosyltransferase family 4 protein [Paludibacteraceae bacterium]